MPSCAAAVPAAHTHLGVQRGVADEDEGTGPAGLDADLMRVRWRSSSWACRLDHAGFGLRHLDDPAAQA
jgi:hypothetical protein